MLIKKIESRSRNRMPASRRSGKKSRGLFSRVWSPFHHALSVGEESVGAVTNTAKGVVRQGLRGVNSIGKSLTRHMNGTVRNVLGKSRKTRKNRKGSRKTRRNARKNTRRH